MMTSDLIDAATLGQFRSPACTVQFTAVVHAADGVRFVVAMTNQSALFERLSQYVLANVEHQLWPRDCIAVIDMLRRGEFEAAVEHYFNCVGSRWDAEWLVCSNAYAC
jgi:hypothetical protein